LIFSAAAAALGQEALSKANGPEDGWIGFSKVYPNAKKGFPPKWQETRMEIKSLWILTETYRKVNESRRLSERTPTPDQDHPRHQEWKKITGPDKTIGLFEDLRGSVLEEGT
jgi:hypothetical protein